MEIILKAIIGYLVKYAADGMRSEVEQALQKELAQNDSLAKAIAASRPLRDELRAACIQLAQQRDRVGISKQEEALWKLLSNDAFQHDLIEWFMAGGIAEGEAVKGRLLQSMETALSKGGASTERIAALKTGYFDALEKKRFFTSCARALASSTESRLSARTGGRIAKTRRRSRRRLCPGKAADRTRSLLRKRACRMGHHRPEQSARG